MTTEKNTVFISGGSAGIGLAIAKKFLATGNTVIINGRNKDRLDAAQKELCGVSAIQGDLALEADRIRIAATLQRDHPAVNIIVNNAGAAFVYPLNTTTNAHEKALVEMNTNYFAIVHFNELLLPHLQEHQEAAVVNISSIIAFGGNKALPTYGASKAALHNYTVALRQTYEDQPRMQVYEVYPPLVNTAFSVEIGGAHGIPPSEVADELLSALAEDRFDVPVGASKKYFQ